MKQIAAETSFTKSSIGRHSLKCVVREAARKVKCSRFDPRRDRVVVIWPPDYKIPEEAIGKEHVWFIKIVWEPAVAPRAPKTKPVIADADSSIEGLLDSLTN